jgi:hypothetical protein
MHGEPVGHSCPVQGDPMTDPIQMVLHVEGMPALIATLRVELAQALREVAADEDAHTAARLRTVAMLFEIGQSDSETR